MSIFDDHDKNYEDYLAKKNPPEYQPGQLPEDEILFGPTDPSDVGTPDSFNSIVNPTGGLDIFGRPVGSETNQQPQRDPNISREEEILEGIFKVTVIFFKKAGSFLVDLYGNIRKTTIFGWHLVLRLIAIYGLSFVGASFVLFLLSFFFKNIHHISWLMYLGVLLSVIGGVGVFLTLDKSLEFDKEYGAIRQKGYEPKSSMVEVPEENQEEGFSDYSQVEDISQYDSSEPYNYGSVDLSEEEEFIEVGSLIDDYVPTEIEKPISLEEALSEIEDANQFSQSRQFLLEKFSKILDSCTPDFSTMREIPEGSEMFLHFNSALIGAATSLGFTEDDYELLSIQENAFIYKIIVRAGVKFKPERVTKSIESGERYNVSTGALVNPNMFATCTIINDVVHIDINKNDTPKFTVKDIWMNNRDTILDSRNEMPVVVGSSPIGEPYIVDMSKVHSISLSGKAGMGKTWMAESIIAQLAMFSGPNDVQFIISDIKGSNGDFYNMNLPHIIEKVYTTEDTVDMLKRLFEEEVPRRSAILESKGYTDISDFRRDFPDIDLPYLYVVIEEMMILGQYMKSASPEVAKKYENNISEIINRFRNLGIRLFSLSQRMTNEAIPRKAKVGVSMKMTVGADQSEVSQALDIKDKEFPYNIASQQGRYAVISPEINKSLPTLFIASILNETNSQNTTTYRFISSLWNKIDPIREVESAKVKVAKEISNASSSELDDILNTVIDI